MKSTHGMSFGSPIHVLSGVHAGNFRRRAILGLSAAAAVMAMGHARSANAQSLYWDMNNNSSGSGGPSPTGTWNDTNTNWNTASDGSSASPGAWVPGDTAVFAAGNDATGAYTVTMGAAETFGGITVEEGSVTIGATINPNPTLQGMGVLNVAGGSTLNFVGGLAGTDSNADGFTKTGNGTLVFTQNDLITGERDILGGGLQIASSLNLAAGGTIMLNGATLTQTNPGNAGSMIQATTAINIGPNNGTFNYASSGAGLVSIYGSGTSTAAIIYGSGTLIKTGTLEFRVQGPGMANNTFTKLKVLGGLYRIGSETGANFETGFGAVPANFTADAITLDGGQIGTSFGVTLNTNRGITLGAGGGTFISNAGGLTDPAAITGPGGLAIIGSAILSGTNDYQGATNITANVGTLTANTTATIQNGHAIPDTSAVTLTNSGSSVATLSVGASEVVGSIAGTGNVALASSSIITAGNDNTSTGFSGNISGIGGIKKVGAGTWSITGNSTYTLGTTVAGGTLKVNNNSYTPLLSNAAGTDIQKGKLVIDYSAIGSASSVKSSIISTLTAGYGNGFSSGQIKSSTAGGQFGLGYKDDTTNQLFTVAYTRYGDANVDGSVDSNDFALLAANYGKTSGTSWNGGDFNYDGTVNALDFNALATNYGQPIPQSGDLPDGALPMASLGSVVPEPATISLVGLAMLGLANRRQRRS